MKTRMILTLLAVLLGTALQAATFYSIASGDWNDRKTWSEVAGGKPAKTLPGPGDLVVIYHWVTYNGGLKVGPGGGVLISGMGILAVKGKLLVERGGRIENYNHLDVHSLDCQGRMYNYGVLYAPQTNVSGFMDNSGKVECSQSLDLMAGASWMNTGGTLLLGKIEMTEGAYYGVHSFSAVEPKGEIATAEAPDYK